MRLKDNDLICLSHLRWGFVFQRPQHLMSRFARTRRVFFFEEPLLEDAEPHLHCSQCASTDVTVCTPILPHGLGHQEILAHQQELLLQLIRQHNLRDYIAWYYTPMAMEFSSVLDPVLTIYDCMDELSAFAGAPPAMRINENALFKQASMVFTGGRSLYESKKKQHGAVYAFPSSVDAAHFMRARTIAHEPDDQSEVPHPRFGYAGVIDERMDLELIKQVAERQPEWQFVFLGPFAKIHPDSVPRAQNIHYLGMKPYAELPAYFSGWDVGILPFALNESTQFISPTKTPEYLAAGLSVISTPIRDVVTPYGDIGLVRIANGSEEFISAANSLLESPTDENWRARIDRFLSLSSWDSTWSAMNNLINKHLLEKQPTASSSKLISLHSAPIEDTANV